MITTEKSKLSEPITQGEQRWSYTSGTSDTPLLGLTIGDLFDHTVETYPDHSALISCHQHIRLTYRELQAQVNQCAKGLMALGLRKGQRIGIWSPNRTEWCITQFATSKIGAILVNINPAYRLHELEYALKQSECSALVIAPQFKTTSYVELIHSLAPELSLSKPGKLKSALLTDLTTVICLGSEKIPGMFSWDEVLAMSNSVSDDQLLKSQSAQEFDDPINIQYTSGTTGFPKGATLSHHNILNNGYFVARLQHFTHEDKLCIPVPLYHCFGMVMGNLGCVTHGAAMVYPSEGFEPLEVLQAVQVEHCTALYGVPTMFIAELDHPDFGTFDLSSLRTGVMAGSPCPVEVMKRVIKLMNMREVEICYGMTETSPVSTQTRLDAPMEKRVSTVGIIHPHLEIKIIDPETEQVVPLGTPGELCTRGYSVMLGYWNNPEATAEAIDPDKIPRYLKVVDSFPMTVTGKIQKFLMRRQSTEELGLQYAASIQTA